MGEDRPTTMKASVLHELGGELAIEQVDVPPLDPFQILVRIEASGLCGTDIHAVKGRWRDKPVIPLIPGHEGIGRVIEAGAAVDSEILGKRVAVGWLGGACGRCEFCVTGREELCQNQINPGFSVSGTLAEYVVAEASHAVEVPDGIDPVEAAPLGCAGVAAFRGVQVSGVGPAEIFAVFGVGGLGHLALQYGRIAGARVVAVDILAGKLDLARDLGAEWVVDASSEDPVEFIQGLGGAHAAVVVAAASKPFEQALAALRPGGSLALVAFPPESDDTLAVPIYDTVAREITIAGSTGGTREDVRKVFDLHAAGKTRLISESRDLESINDAIRDVEEGRVSGRVVLVP